jgi:hypothetical protein
LNSPIGSFQAATKAATKAPTKAATSGIAKASLLTLPSEIMLMIFSYLNPSPSVCLGLSSKLLYPLHRSLHGKVPLRKYSWSYAWCSDENLLHLLAQWMDSVDFIYHGRKMKFVHLKSLKKEERGLLLSEKGVRYLGWL